MIEQSGKKYRAFISYSHEDDDWGKWLHRSIESYRVPRYLVGRETKEGVIPRRLIPVFRDRDELASSSDLGNTLRRALEDAEWLLVICSPRSATSEWVCEEIRSFIRSGRENRILALIAYGEPNNLDPAKECFPEPLRQTAKENKEPLAADARHDGDGKTNARLKLIACMLGVGFDELRQREGRRRKQRVLTTLAILISSLGILGWFGWKAREEAEASRKIQYMNTISQVQMAIQAYDVRKARALLKNAPEDLREWEWHRLLYLSDQAITTLKGHFFPIHKVFSNPEGTWIISLSTDNAVRRWDVARRMEVTGPFPEAPAGEHRDVWTDGKKIHLLDAESGRIFERWLASGTNMHEGRVTGVALSPDGNRVASVGEDGTVRIWDPIREVLLVTREIDTKPLMAVAYNPNGENLVVGGRDGLLELLFLDGQHHRTLNGQEADILALTYSPKGERLLTGDASGVAIIWDLSEPVTILRGHRGEIKDVGFRRDGEQVATAGADGSLRIWDDARGIELRKMQGHQGEVNALDYLGDGFLIATGGEDGLLKLWDLGELPISTQAQKTESILQPEESGENNRIELKKEGNIVHVLGNNKSVLTTLRGHSDVVTAVAVSQSGRRILTASKDGTVRLWNVTDGQQIFTVAANLPGIISLDFGLKDREISAVLDSGKSRLWPVAQNQKLHSASKDRDATVPLRIREAARFAKGLRFHDALIVLEEVMSIRPQDSQIEKRYQEYHQALSLIRKEKRAARKGREAEKALKVLEPFRPTVTFDERLPAKPVIRIEFSNYYSRLTDDVLSHLQAFPSLRELRFVHQTQITDEGLRHIGQLSTLEILAFNATDSLTDEGLRHLAGLRNLQVLDLSKTTLVGSGLGHLNHLPIKELHLHSMSYHSSGFRDIDLTAIANMITLEVLNLGDANVTDENLAALAGLINLRHLDLKDMRAGNSALANLKTLSKLEVLDLSDSHRIGDEGLKVLGELLKLHTLRLRKVNMIGPAMQEIGKLINLRRLDIGENWKLTDEALEPLAQLHQLEELKVGGIYANTWITDVTMSYIAKLVKLRRLDLFGLENLTDVGIRKISDLKHLEWLHLGKTSVTSAGLSILEDLPKLRTLNLHNSKVAWDDKKAIKAKFPRLSIE